MAFKPDPDSTKIETDDPVLSALFEHLSYGAKPVKMSVRTETISSPVLNTSIRSKSANFQIQYPPVPASAQRDPAGSEAYAALMVSPRRLAADMGPWQTAVRPAPVEQNLSISTEAVPTNHGIDDGPEGFMAVHVPPHLIVRQ